jgi:predicted nucleic acid-binding protein
MYLLDTDIVIYILKGHPTVKRNLQNFPHDPVKLCVITLMELYYGASKSQRPMSNSAKIRTLETSLEMLPVGQEVVEIFGMEKAKLERLGTPLDDFDLVLGCCALAHNLTLVTNNVKHFKKIEGLRVVNWAEETD